MAKLLNRILIVLFISGLVFGSLIGCSDNDNEENYNSQLPALPPDDSMSMDFSTFEGDKMAPSTLMPGKNYTNAAARVLAIDSAVVGILASPVTVFKAAKNTAPVEQDDGSWVYTYSVAYLGNEYKAVLTGSTQKNKNLWSMKITCPTLQPPLKDFEWYVGECASNNTSGTWQFFDYKSPNEAKEVGSIEWSVSAIKKSKIVFTCKDADNEIFNDVLTYSLEGTIVTMTYLDSSKDITPDITWDMTTDAGSIKVPNYNNGERAYWDENKQDVDQ